MIHIDDLGVGCSQSQCIFQENKSRAPADAVFVRIKEGWFEGLVGHSILVKSRTKKNFECR